MAKKRREFLKELKDKSLADLKALLEGEKGASQDLFSARFKLAAFAEKNTHDLSDRKKNIARIKTLIRQKEIAETKMAITSK